jgi:WD40 repeat protein
MRKRQWYAIWIPLYFIMVGCQSLVQQPTPYQVVGQIDLDQDDPYFLVDSMDWLSTPDVIAIGDSRANYLYNIENNQLSRLSNGSGTPGTLKWSPDGYRLLGTGRGLWIWNSLTSQFFNSPENLDNYSYYGSVFWNHDGTSVLGTLAHSNVNTSEIRKWDVEANLISPVNIPTVANPIVLDWSPDEKLIAVTDLNLGPIQLVELPSMQVVHTFRGGEVAPVAWNSTGTRFVTNTPAGDLEIWDTTNWQAISILPNQGDFGRSIRWYPQGDYLATAGDSGVIIWNIASATFSVVSDKPASVVTWDAQGKRLTSATGNTIYIWDIAQLP